MSLLYNIALCTALPAIAYVGQRYLLGRSAVMREEATTGDIPDDLTQEISARIRDSLESFLASERKLIISDEGAEFDMDALLEAKILARSTGVIKKDIYEDEEMRRKHCHVAVSYTSASQTGFLCTQPYVNALAKAIAYTSSELGHPTTVFSLGKDAAILKREEDPLDIQMMQERMRSPALNFNHGLETLACLDADHPLDRIVHFVLINGQSPMKDHRYIPQQKPGPYATRVFYEINPHIQTSDSTILAFLDTAIHRLWPAAPHDKYGSSTTDDTDALASEFSNFLMQQKRS